MEFKNISQGFLNLLKKELGIENPELEKKAVERLNICSNCNTRSNFPEPLSRLSKCNNCGCILTAKTRSNSNCPLKKW